MPVGTEARKSLEQLREFPDYANKANPLHRAAARGDVAFLQTLHDNLDLSKICMRDNLGATPLHVATRENRHQCLQWLLDNTSLSVTERASAGETPLHVAAARGHASLLQLLVRHAAPSAEARAAALLSPDSQQLTALHLAALKGHQPVVNWIVMEYKAFLAPLMETGNVTPAHLAASEGHLEVLRTLLSSANRYNGWGEARDPDGTPIAYFAAQEARLDCLKFLLEEISVAPEAACQQDGMTGMHAAAQSGHDVIIKYYVGKLGGDVIKWRTNDGAIPLHFAAGTGHSSTVELLLAQDEAGSTLGMTDDNLITPLHEAINFGFPECARILMEAGAEVRAEDKEGHSPLSIVSQDAFHPCRSVVMEAMESKSENVVNEETQLQRIPEQESGNQGSDSARSITPQNPTPHSNPSSSVHSIKPAPLSGKNKSLGELSYLLSPLLSDSSPLPPGDKLLAGMGRRTARRQRRWLSRPVAPPPPPLLPLLPLLTPPDAPEEAAAFSEQIREASDRIGTRGAQSEAPRRQLGSLVKERMNSLGGAPAALPAPALLPVAEETGTAVISVGDAPVRALPAELPVSVELEFFYGDQPESNQSDSETTLSQSPVHASSLDSAVETGTDRDEAPEEPITEDEQNQSEHSHAKLTGPAALPEIEYIEVEDESLPSEPERPPGVPVLGLPPLPAEEILASGFCEERRAKRRFAGLRRIGRLLGRKEREESPGEGLAAFEAIMQRNLIIQEQIRSAPYPQLPPGILEPVVASTAARGPADAPAWPEEIPAESESADTRAPPSSSSESVPEVQMRHIRSVPPSPLRPISTNIAIQTESPFELAEPPAAPFTASPTLTLTPTPTLASAPVPAAEIKPRVEVSSRIADLTQSLLVAAVPVPRPYSPDAVYASPRPRPPGAIQATENVDSHKNVSAEKEISLHFQAPPQTQITQSEGVKLSSATPTSGYDVPSWGEAREYLRRVTARQQAGPVDYEDDLVAPVESETGVLPVTGPDNAKEILKDSDRTGEAADWVEEARLPPLSRSPRFQNLKAATDPLKDWDSTPNRRKLTPAPPRPRGGTEVQKLRQKFSESPQSDVSRPQKPRAAPLKPQTAPLKPVRSPARPVETARGPVRPVKSSLAVQKLSSVKEEAPSASRLLMDMLMDSGGRKPATATPLDLLIEKSELAGDTGLGAEVSGERGGRELSEGVQVVRVGEEGSMRAEVQGLSLSGQVRERIKMFH